MVDYRRSEARRAPSKALLFLSLVTFGGATMGFTASSNADVIEVSGSAFGHYTNVSLFGGPSVPKGPVAKVTLPGEGADPALVAKVPSSSAVYGPATIFGGKWPPHVDTAPPSGPITATTKGTKGPGGSVTSTVDIVLRSPANPDSPGGWGPTVPSEGDELHSSCTADESGVRGSVRLVNGILSTSTDESGEPKDQEPIPEYPPVNYTREGVITNVGDRWRIVFNEQIVEGNSITVNAIHMFLLGDIAVGEQIVGQVKCGVNVGPGSAVAPSSSGDPGTNAGSTAAGSTAGATAAGSTSASAKPGAKPAAKATTASTAAPSTTTPPSSSDVTAPPSSEVTAAPPTSAADSASSDDSLASSPIAAKKDDSGSVLPFLLGAVVLVGGGALIAPRVRRRRLAGTENIPDGPL